MDKKGLVLDTLIKVRENFLDEIIYAEYICSEILFLTGHTQKNNETLMFVKLFKPSESFLKEFTEHESWTGEFSWWFWVGDIPPEINSEKIKYLTYLIDHIDELYEIFQNNKPTIN